MIDGGDRIVVRLTERGRQVGPLMGVEPSGNDFAVSMIHIVRIVDRRIVEHWREADTLGFVQQLEAHRAAS